MYVRRALALAFALVLGISICVNVAAVAVAAETEEAEGNMFSEQDVQEVRHVVQFILVPCVFVIGLLGNSVSIYVLTRKRMRCTTNIYLTALAITDICYLTMLLLLSLQHYDYIKRNHEFYWMCFGTLVWLHDACSYNSIYIAVCFTIERFIAIRYPLKRQTFCTEALAKKVIAGVALFCLFSTISTAFEHEYHIATKLIDGHGRPCNPTLANAAATAATTPKTHNFSADEATAALWHGSGSGPIQAAEMLLQQQQQEVALGSELLTAKRNAAIDATKQRATRLKASNIPNLAMESLLPDNSNFLIDAEFLASGVDDGIDKAMHSMEISKQIPTTEPKETILNYALQQNDSFAFNVTEYCQNVTYFQHIYSSLGLDPLYRRIWYLLTTFVFVLIPFCVLSTFNCFLIMLVRRSKSLRGEMTNASSMRGPRRKMQSSVSQENRVTVTLIVVVLLFILCQLPWAFFLIITEHFDIGENVQTIMGNVLNFLVAINAASNFFLYCVLSDKYRKTVRELITGYRYRGGQRRTLMSSSLYTHATTNGSRRYRPKAASVVIK